MAEATFSYKPRVSSITITGTITNENSDPITDKQASVLLNEIVGIIGDYDFVVGTLTLVTK